MENITKKIVSWKIVEKEKEEKTDYFALPRPQILKSETHKIKMDTGEDVKNAYITVSFFDNTREPYEVLINTAVNNSLKDMQILELSARMTSLALRHGVPLKFIIDQLYKINGQYIYSIPSTLAKTLEEYIPPEGEDYSIPPEGNGDYSVVEHKPKPKVTGMKCPQCGENKYTKTDGCYQCMSCGYSKCG